MIYPLMTYLQWIAFQMEFDRYVSCFNLQKSTPLCHKYVHFVVVGGWPCALEWVRSAGGTAHQTQWGVFFAALQCKASWLQLGYTSLYHFCKLALTSFSTKKHIIPENKPSKSFKSCYMQHHFLVLTFVFEVSKVISWRTKQTYKPDYYKFKAYSTFLTIFGPWDF